MGAILGVFVGFTLFFILRYLAAGLYTVDQNERAVVTSFGRAERVGHGSILETPIAESLNDDEKARYAYPQVRVVGPGGPYFKFPWQRVHKVNVAVQTVSIAFDPESPSANQGGAVLDAVTKDQLNIGITGQLRYQVAESNLYAYLFGVRNPIAHVMGYFISILRERIANFEAQARPLDAPGLSKDALTIEGISINDLRKNLNSLNEQMDMECRSSSARYGILLDASLITGIDPPQDIESALAAINTAHNEVSANISIAQAAADQKIEQSKRAVEIETMRAEAEVQPLRALAEQLAALKESSPNALAAYLRNVRLELYHKARQVFMEGSR